MAAIKKPTEFAINMMLERFKLIQQSELAIVNDDNYFSRDYPCHIYFICKRPRISINPEKFKITKDYIEIVFRQQHKDEFKEFPITFANNGNLDITLITEYSYTDFKFVNNGEIIIEGRAAVFLNSIIDYRYELLELLDLEVLYIGQSYGVDGARTAPDRLKSHSTLQGIYSEAIQKNPDCDIWLLLASFVQVNITMFIPRTSFTQEEIFEHDKKAKEVFNKLNRGDINEQQKVNFTEAALIRYFEPPYNVIYKDSFPNPAHKTYSECYDLDINSIAIELPTMEKATFRLYSKKIAPLGRHMHDFLIHSKDERISMFNYFGE